MENKKTDSEHNNVSPASCCEEQELKRELDKIKMTGVSYT